MADGGVSDVTSDERVQISDGELRIAVTEKADTGLYTCTAVNSEGVASASAYLRVTSTSRCYMSVSRHLSS